MKSLKVPSTVLTCLLRNSLCKSTESYQLSGQISKRYFLQLPFQSTKKCFSDQTIVKLSQLQLYDVVADVDEYYKFVPNCIESNVLYRTANRMEAELTVGIPNLLSEKYTSIVHLNKPTSIIVQTSNSKILKHLQSEWKFENVLVNQSNQTLVTFKVEFEFYSKLHSSVMNLFFDDLTIKTMQAFINRAHNIYQNPNKIS